MVDFEVVLEIGVINPEIMMFDLAFFWVGEPIA